MSERGKANRRTEAGEVSRQRRVGGTGTSGQAGRRNQAHRDRIWDEAYEIDWDDGRFRAGRLDGRGGVEAATARELRDLILADYTACPVPRRHPKDPEDE